MEKALSLAVFIMFSIMFASVENKVKANICQDALGNCNQCDQRCKAKQGPTGQGSCDGKFQLCTCNYTCGPFPSPPAYKVCYGGTGMCSPKCGKQCCNQDCAQKYPAGVGFCDRLGSNLLCKCQYPC